MVRKKKQFHFLHGNNETPQYFCPKCGKAHTKHSIIGNRHRKIGEF